MARRILQGYLRLLNTHPFKTQVLTAATLMATGDVVSQTLVEKRSLLKLDYSRTGRFFVFGIVILGPTLRTWYVFLERYIHGPAKIVPMYRLALDQLVFAPWFIVVFVSVMDYWKSRSLASVKAKLSQDYKEMLINNYKLWPAAQIINFYLLPLNYRILYVNSVAIIWNTYISYVSEAKTVPKVEENQKS